MGLLSSLFGGSKSSSSVATTTTTQNTTENYDQRFSVGADSIGLAQDANFSLINELPTNAVDLLSNFGEIIGAVAARGVDNVATVASAGQKNVNELTKQVRASGAAIDLQTLSPYLLAAGGIATLYFIFRKG